MEPETNIVNYLNNIIVGYDDKNIQQYDFEIEVAIHNFFEDTTTIEKRIMTKLDVYYWDEDDHRCCDFYIYNSGRREKLYDLTSESMKKIYDYLYNYLKDNNLIEVDENGNVTKNYNRKNW